MFLIKKYRTPFCHKKSTEQVFLIKKVVAPFDKKEPAYGKKRTDNPREESITEESFKEPVTEDSKKTLSLRTYKKDPFAEDL